jgi:ubiquinone/menaquinone biosynthesis C-methylase UbiE
MTDQTRQENERKHGEFLSQQDPEQIWGWKSLIGQIRWQKRLQLLMSHVTTSMDILEVGCGTGILTRELAQKCTTVTAIDISPDLLKYARQKLAAYTNFTLETGDAHRLSYQDQSFDMVIGNSILHHLDSQACLLEFLRVLKPGGFIAFAEPNMKNPQIFLQKNIPYLKKLAGDSPDETAILRGKMHKLLKKQGFEQIQLLPFDFLHPSTPNILIPYVNRLSFTLEKTPLVREIAGSIFISARKTRPL